MRLWHKDLIPVLPHQQLLAQWRECCCIACNIAVNGTPNHILVNKILDYPSEHFYGYAAQVYAEMKCRGYQCDWDKFKRWTNKWPDVTPIHNEGRIFEDWHNDRYLNQCFYNLQEKYDCGGIPEDEWQKIASICQFK